MEAEEEKMNREGPWSPYAARKNVPFRHPPMIANAGFRAQMGIAPAIAVAAKWGLPWLLTALGIGVTAYAAKSAFPQIPINQEKIGLAALIGGAGVASYLVSDIVPEGWKSIPYGIAVLGIGGAAYFLFSPAPEKPPPPPTGGMVQPEIDPRYRVPSVSREFTSGELDRLIDVRLDPEQSETGGLVRSEVVDQEYGFSVLNTGNQAVGFWAGLNIQDETGKVIFRSPTGAEPSVYQRKQIVAQPKTPKGEAEKLRAPAHSGVASVLYSWIVGPSPMTTVGVELFRLRDDTKPFKVSPAIQILQVHPLHTLLKK